MMDTPPHLPAIVDATPHTSLAQPADALAPLDYLILLWLHEQASPRTRREYAITRRSDDPTRSEFVILAVSPAGHEHHIGSTAQWDALHLSR